MLGRLPQPAADVICEEGHVEFIQMLRQKTNNKWDVEPKQCLEKAVSNGQTGMVSHLLNTYDCGENECHFQAFRELEGPQRLKMVTAMAESGKVDFGRQIDGELCFEQPQAGDVDEATILAEKLATLRKA